MPRDQKGEIRRGQLITTYGVGSIVAFDDESFMVAGADEWGTTGMEIHEPRLERRLGVSGFRLPPASEDGEDIPVVRFPEWGHCPTCKTLDRLKRLAGGSRRNTCTTCADVLVPSRFVICCEAGHIDDFPWFGWVHAGSPPAGNQHDMTLESGGLTASLGDIRVICTCGKQATMENVFQREALKRVSSCNGRRPWLTVDETECQQLPRVLQRGASNVWFSITHSALSIPPWSQGAFKVLNARWDVIRYITDEATLRGMITGMRIAEGTPYSVDDLVRVVRERQDGEALDSDATSHDLKLDEHRALIANTPERERGQDFVCVPGDLPDDLRSWFSSVMLATRLREVRALQGFTRINPPSSDSAAQTQPIFESHLDWLPAIEVHGEGIFLELDEGALERWEQLEAVRKRAEVVNRRFHESSGLRSTSVTISPRLMLVHTFAHALINQWSLSAGYPAASLRERIYVDGGIAGLLIYTGTSDSAGSLGGVVASAAPQVLLSNVREAVRRSSWCSGDPLCVESEASGTDGLNLAACHACALLPEVSCEEMNRFLDRALLIGTPENQAIGFFSALMEP